MAEERIALALRIVMVAPPPGVAIAMQRGRDALEPPAAKIGADLVFDFEVQAIRTGGAPRLLGPFVQGPPAARFVYINSGTYAGHLGSPYGRRAKVPLTGVTDAMIAALAAGQRLEARFTGAAKDGGPTAASVRLLDLGWRTITP